jgi:hypothetical protein
MDRGWCDLDVLRSVWKESVGSSAISVWALEKEREEMNRFVMVVLSGMVAVAIPGVARADELELKAAGPKDKSLQTVLRYSGSDVPTALSGGNKLKESKKLHELVTVDAKDPKSGTLQWRGFEVKRNGKTVQITNLGKGLEVRLKRKDKDAPDWEMTEDAIKLVSTTIARSR